MTVTAELNVDGIELLYRPMDNYLYYTTEWGWEQAINYVRDVFDFPHYTPQKWDCDDFAFMMRGLLAVYFQLTSCAFIIGNNGGHAFNRIRTDEIWLNLEPQTGGFPNGYTAEKALI